MLERRCSVIEKERDVEILFVRDFVNSEPWAVGVCLL